MSQSLFQSGYVPQSYTHPTAQAKWLHGLVLVEDTILPLQCSLHFLQQLEFMIHTCTYFMVNLGFAADDSGGCLVNSTSFMLRSELSWFCFHVAEHPSHWIYNLLCRKHGAYEWLSAPCGVWILGTVNPPPCHIEDTNWLVNTFSYTNHFPLFVKH